MSDVQYPSDWTVAPLEQLIEFALGGDWGKDDDFNHPDYVPVRCIRASELRSWETEKGLTAAKRMIRLASFEKRELVDGDILVEVSGGGPEQPVGRTVLIDKSVLAQNPHEKKICTNFFRMLRLRDCVAPGYLNYYLQHFYKSGKISEYQAGSNNLRNLKFKDYIKISVPFPPLDVQKDIVAKIESLLSELDKGIESLKTAREQLKVYRQAVLKHAFEGKLTAQWREENKDKLESSEQLLARIQRERYGYLEDKVNTGDLEAKRFLNKIKKSKKIYPADFPSESACWVSMIDVCLLIVDCHNKTAPYEDEGIWLIRTPCIKDGKIHLNHEARFISEETYDYWARRCPPEPGDLIFTREAPMGEAGLVPEGVRLCMGQRMMLLRPPKQLIGRYLLYAVTEPKFSERMNGAAIGTGVKHLRVGDVEELFIPLFSLEEQKEIVRQIDVRFEVVEQNEKEIDDALQRSEILRQSILKKGFSGKLPIQ